MSTPRGSGEQAAAGHTQFAHAADVGIRAWGPTLAAAFEQAALAMTEVVTDPLHVRARREVEVSCEAPSAELLLVEWLNELVYRMATERMLFSAFRVTVSGTRLEGHAWGEPVDRARHEPAAEVKGATYTALEVRQEPSGRWAVQCVLDV